MNRRNFSRILTMVAGGTWIGAQKGIMKPSEDQKTKTVVYPHEIKIGDTIGLITPASPTSNSNVEKSIKSIERLGFKVKKTKRLNSDFGFLAGKDQLRADDIHEMLDDPEVKAIWCVRGGYGTSRILPFLDFNKIREKRKPLIGFSDITALHNAIYHKTGLVGLHGPVGTSEYTDYTMQGILPMLTGQLNQLVIQPNKNLAAEEIYPTVIKEGNAKGRLIGGNLTVFASMCGTSYMPDCEGAILFLEDIGEVPYRLDRCLNQLKQSIDFIKLSGIVLGNFFNCNPKSGMLSLGLKETFIESFRTYDFPIIYGYSFGHITNLCTFPVGAMAEMKTDDLTVKIIKE